MIFCKFSEINIYKNISPNFSKCVEFIESNSLMSLPLGKTEIGGNSVYVNKMEIETNDVNRITPESHKKYIDIHVDLIGNEEIGIVNGEIKCLSQYSDQDDVQLYSFTLPDIRFNLLNDYCLICFPEEKHIPGIGNKSKVLKCCFKVAIE